MNATSSFVKRRAMNIARNAGYRHFFRVAALLWIACLPQAWGQNTALTAQSSELNGVWEGTIGDRLILACLDSNHRSAFYFLRDQVEISLEKQGQDWVESASDVAQAHWRLEEGQDQTYSSGWRLIDAQSTAKSAIRLSRINVESNDVAPCESTAYKLQLQELPDASLKAAPQSSVVDAIHYKPKTIAAGDDHSAVITADGSLWMWGSNASGRLGDGTDTDRRAPVKIGSGFAQVFAAYDKTAAIKKDGSLWTWYQVRNITSSGYHFHNMVTKVGLGFANADVSTRGPGVIAVGLDGTLWADYRPNAARRDPLLLNIGDGFVRAVLGQTGSGSTYAAAIKTDGSLWAWAYNGNLPIDDKLNRQLKSPIKVGEGFVDLESHWGHIVGTKKDGSLWQWNASGAWSASGSMQLLAIAEVVPLAASRAKVIADTTRTFSLKSDGSLWASGANFNGGPPLGDGTLVDRAIPVLIGQDYREISTGAYHVLAKKEDDTVWFWGAHGGKLEQDQVNVGKDFAQVAAGPLHTLALKKNGSLWAWGSNREGQLGATEAKAIYDRPVEIGRGYKQIATSGMHSLAIKKDGTLWA